MPIKVSLSYMSRQASEQAALPAGLRKDLATVSEIFDQLAAIMPSQDESAARLELLRVLQDMKLSCQRLLSDDAEFALVETTTLAHHERFELIHLVAMVQSIGEALDGSLSGVPRAAKKRTSKPARPKASSPPDIERHEIERKALEEALKAKLDTLRNSELSFLIGAAPNAHVRPFLISVTDYLMHFVRLRFMDADREVLEHFPDAVLKSFSVWLAKQSKSALWLASYLNYEHQKSRVDQVAGDVRSIQQALSNWTQPTTEFARRRKQAWDKYRKNLQSLPDQTETMFDENFGVRRVFVQPKAAYRVAGGQSDAVSEFGDVANLIAALISERVPSDELILLCGGPGSGKSTLCRVIASELAANEEIHPVFLRLRRLQDGQDIPTFLESHLQKEGLIDKFSELADVSNLVLILDGFDELVMASRSRLREFFNTLREDLQSGPLRNAKAIVSGRDTLFPGGRNLPTGSHVISLLAFDKPRITVWGEKWRALHPGSDNPFQPEAFYENAAQKRTTPLHHLVSWPLTLHLVARVHKAGKLKIDPATPHAVEKATLYRSIVAETALRQQDQQKKGKGRLGPDKMRDFVQAISWEMYSTSRDALDYSEGLPLLRQAIPGISEADLAELADVAIVNQPELTKGEEGGFEFVHKSFSEYFVAERIAHTLERVAFKVQDYDRAEPSWRMTSREALAALSELFAIRPLTAEVQEMLEPMLASYRLFHEPADNPDADQARRSQIKALEVKLDRIGSLIGEYASGDLHPEIYDNVRQSKTIRTALEAHANLSVGLLAVGCALARRIDALATKKTTASAALRVEGKSLWRLVSFIQSGDIPVDEQLAARCLQPVAVSGDRIEVWYPAVPPRLLAGVSGLSLPLASATADAIDGLFLMEIEAALSRMFPRLDRELRPEYRYWRSEYGGPMRMRSFVEFLEVLERAGLTGPEGFDRRYPHVLLRRLEELLHELSSRPAASLPPDFAHEIQRRLHEVVYEFERRPRPRHLQPQLERLYDMIKSIARRA